MSKQPRGLLAIALDLPLLDKASFSVPQPQKPLIDAGTSLPEEEPFSTTTRYTPGPSPGRVAYDIFKDDQDEMTNQIKIPTFRGVKGDDVDDFLKKCKMVYAFQARYFVDEEDQRDAKLALLTSNLAGSALSWYQMLSKQDRNDYELVARKLKKKFGVALTIAQKTQATLDFGNLRQESLSNEAYVQKARQIREVLGEDWDTAVAEQFIQGLANDTMRMVVTLSTKRGETSFEDVAQRLLNLNYGKEEKEQIEKSEIIGIDKDNTAILQYIAQMNKDILESTLKTSLEREKTSRDEERARDRERQERERMLMQAITDGIQRLSVQSNRAPNGSLGPPRQPFPRTPQGAMPPRPYPNEYTPTRGYQPRTPYQPRPANPYQTCYNCGVREHYSPQCPAPPASPAKREEIGNRITREIAEHEARMGPPVMGRAAQAALVESQDARNHHDRHVRFEQPWRQPEASPKSARNGWVEDVTEEFLERESPAHNGDQVCLVEEVFTTRRTRSEARLDQPDGFGNRGRGIGDQRDPKRAREGDGPRRGGKTTRGRTPRPPVPIRMMKNHGTYDVVRAFRETNVEGMEWGHLLDMAPRATLEIARALVRERKPRNQAGNGRERVIDESRDVTMEDASAQTMAAVGGERHRIGNYYTRIVVSAHGRTYRVSEVLIDGGSTLNCISAETADSLSLQRPGGPRIEMKTAHGGTRILKEMVDLTFTIAGVPSQVKAYIVDTDRPPFSVLLGRPWMHKVDVRGQYGTVRPAGLGGVPRQCD
ncbi:MAG: hypothetical protein M1823_002682 [Watsoniomyces obsoletus]|nr:MAG: hypothetical protein M1823_002682 [Watsoniomyces obsoletus]